MTTVDPGVPAPVRRADASPGEEERQRECAAEPIHRPGAIQPHGALVAVDPATGLVVQVSAGTTVLGRDPQELLGGPLAALVGEPHAAALLAGVAPRPASDGPGERPGDADTDPLPVEVAGRTFDAIAHRSVDGLGIIELEPSDGAPDRWLSTLHSSIQRLSRSASVGELRQEAARTVRRLTGFDRVMVYHFHPDEHGEVVAEDKADHLEPYLGLHYPASDIPAQARAVYTSRLSRTIPDRDYTPAPLVPALNPLTGAPTDLTRSELRSVSPHHLEFLRNMGVAATLSISLVHEGRLVGMISCNNDTPRHVTYALRRGCEILGQQVTLQSSALAETRRLERRLELQAVRARLADQFGAADDVAAALVARQVTLADVVRAEGVVVRLDGRTATLGDTPDEATVDALLAALGPVSDAFVTSTLAADRPDLATLLPGVAGLVVVPVGDDGDVLAWFRPAFGQVVEWLGDQGAGNRATPLSPRSSFNRWRETVTDRAMGWDELDLAEAVALRDVLVRHLAQLRARRAASRAVLTAHVTSRLAETLDAQEAVARLARLVVPELADWCIVSLVEDDHPGGRRVLRDVGSWHHDPAVRPRVERYAEVRRDALRSDSFVRRALDSGEVIVVERDAVDQIRAVLRPGEALDLLLELAPEAVVVLPLRARNRTVGLISLYTGRGGRTTPEQVATAQEVAGRAGLALDNARLYHEQLLLAEGLQRSLLTEPPHVQGLSVAVRYTPAAEAAKVGGDWYDAFLQPGGALNVVIGDVTGHDVIAAAAMGQLRSLVRGIAATTDAGPAEVLRRVDRAIDTLRVETLATAVVVRIERLPGGGARACWSNAGHPGLVVVLPDGTVHAPVVRPDLVLGVLAGTDRHEHSLELPEGAVLVLYTDGLVERRGERLQDGLARLQAVLARLPHDDVETLCDDLLDAMLPERGDDDVAIVAVRIGG
ncbi:MULTISPECIES: SpoIIE family protein phosphatase [unclassified Actinotalea]|uniref:SpoIIE family protein phosphatase n=1 Tax=unclassified Actinotalea TaxID=2638618 RepID=UPI0015F6CD05|nr:MULTISPECIES: SpoIIE family protein phosphatase [unclassified Actinotalea]